MLKPYEQYCEELSRLEKHAAANAAGVKIHNHHDHPNCFSLYSSLPGVEKATADGIKVIEDFIAAWKKWQEKYKKLGAGDTASCDAFVNKLDAMLGKIDVY